MKALVLLSGGIDSVAAMLALKDQHELSAITYDYGQPAASSEAASAELISGRYGIPWSLRSIGSAICSDRLSAEHNPGEPVAPAFLPARNLILMAASAGEACRRWPGEKSSIVVGCNLTDSWRFPDTTHPFITATEHALRLGLKGVSEVGILAPWVDTTKEGILRWAQRAGYLKTVLASSKSCYLGTECGACGACVERSEAISALDE
jgi:queuosine biosynthesis protein QueC